MGSFNNFKTTKHKKSRLGKVETLLNEKLSTVKWGSYKLGDLFEINPTKYYRLQNEEIISKNGKVPLIYRPLNNSSN